jgi:hypothetical protein
MLKWPTRAQRAVASFFVKWNDVDVFVEDTAKYASTVYTQFLGRILDGRASVTSIFPLGDKISVIEACAADTSVGGRNRIYLVDGDLDLISAIPPVNLPRLYTHAVYHLENYFICEDALIGVLHEENPRFNEEEVRVRLDFSGWVREIQPFLYLFRVFGISRILDPSLATVKMGVGMFATSNKIDLEKVRAFCKDRVELLEKNFPKEDVDKAKSSVDGVVEKKARQQDLVSAREYLLPCLRWWVASKGLQLPAGKESLLFRLSKRSSLEPHSELVAAICATARN